MQCRIKLNTLLIVCIQMWGGPSRSTLHKTPYFNMITYQQHVRIETIFCNNIAQHFWQKLLKMIKENTCHCILVNFCISSDVADYPWAPPTLLFASKWTRNKRALQKLFSKCLLCLLLAMNPKNWVLVH